MEESVQATNVMTKNVVTVIQDISLEEIAQQVTS